MGSFAQTDTGPYPHCGVGRRHAASGKWSLAARGLRHIKHPVAHHQPLGSTKIASIRREGLLVGR